MCWKKLGCYWNGLTINTKTKKIQWRYKLIDIAKAFTPQKWSSLKLEDRMRLFLEKITNFASRTLESQLFPFLLHQRSFC
jgi:hypothetical protein